MPKEGVRPAAGGGIHHCMHTHALCKSTHGVGAGWGEMGAGTEARAGDAECMHCCLEAGRGLFCGPGTALGPPGRWTASALSVGRTQPPSTHRVPHSTAHCMACKCIRLPRQTNPPLQRYSPQPPLASGAGSLRGTRRSVLRRHCRPPAQRPPLLTSCPSTEFPPHRPPRPPAHHPCSTREVCYSSNSLGPG
jgi:hypothetical protein